MLDVQQVALLMGLGFYAHLMVEMEIGIFPALLAQAVQVLVALKLVVVTVEQVAQIMDIKYTVILL
jgi:hypothetical protein